MAQVAERLPSRHKDLALIPILKDKWYEKPTLDKVHGAKAWATNLVTGGHWLSTPPEFLESSQQQETGQRDN